MAWDWLAEVAWASLDLLVPSPPDDAPAEPPRVGLWTLGGAVVLGSAGALAALFLFPPIPPAGYFDLSPDSMTKARTVGFVSCMCGGLVLGAILGRALAMRGESGRS